MAVTNMSSSSDQQQQLSSDLTKFLSSLASCDPNLIAQLTDGSLDLTSYQTVVEAELAELEAEQIRIHRNVIREDVSTLASELDMCESILESLQETLLGFSADLDGLSGDIQSLQRQSLAMSLQLENRKEADKSLTTFLQNVVIPPQMANAIIYDDVDDATFVACVLDLERKYEYVNMNNGGEEKNVDSGDSVSEKDSSLFVPPPPNQTVAGREVKGHLEKLRLKAIDRTRNFFLKKIADLRKPKTNVRMIQVNSLLKFAPLIDFLRDAAPDIYQEVKDVYVESMGKMIHLLFRVYLAQLNRLDEKVVNRFNAQLIAVSENVLRSYGSNNANDTWTSVYNSFSPSPKTNSAPTSDSFHLGDRACVLDLCDKRAKPILVHLALSKDQKFPYEQLFRSIVMHLIDSQTNEYVFCLKFFKDQGRDVFRKIFNRTVNLILETTENYLFNCYDSIGLLLMIQINHAHRTILKERRVKDESIDSFFDRINHLLWPRFQELFDSQLKCLRGANGKRLGLVSASSKSTSAIELHSHYVARRYAEFTSSILLVLQHKRQHRGEWNISRLRKNDEEATKMAFNSPFSNAKRVLFPNSDSSEHLDTKEKAMTVENIILENLFSIQNETIELLHRITEGYGENKRKTIFLINNLDQILGIFEERRVFSFKQICGPFEELLTRQRELFVEEELVDVYSKLIGFVKQNEVNSQSLNSTLVESLVRDFALNWQKGIEQINKNVLSYFSNFRNGLEILKQVLTQLLLYYTRFQDILRKGYRGRLPDFCKHLVTTTQILTEIKKYALSI